MTKQMVSVTTFQCLTYIKACGLLKGNGMAYYIEGHPEFKFRLATYKKYV